MKPVRSRAHLNFIRSLPCLVPRCNARYVEASHIGGHGLSQKASDLDAAPICPRHHRTGPDSLHKLGRRRFEQLHGVDLMATVSRLRQRPKLSIQDGYYIAVLDDNELMAYMAGRIDIGLKEAIRRSIEFFRECYIEDARRRKATEAIAS